jgi:hypothetical protein
MAYVASMKYTHKQRNVMRDLKALVDGLATAKAWAGLDYSGKQRREISADVTLGPTKDGKGRMVLELSVSHYKEGKRYVASLHVIKVEELESGFTSREYSLSLGRDNRLGGQLDAVESGRYSTKALDAFWELQIGKLQDDPSILAKLDLEHNQEPQEEEIEGWFAASKLLDALKAEGIEGAWVWQSGGGTATIMIPNEGGIPTLVGPGSYHWEEPGKSLFTMDELAYGLDYHDYYEKYGEEPKDNMVPKDSTIADAAKLIAEQYRKDSSK